jgi:hypothetical protein
LIAKIFESANEICSHEFMDMYEHLLIEFLSFF